jgi:hypothetical protein
MVLTGDGAVMGFVIGVLVLIAAVLLSVIGEGGDDDEHGDDSDGW